MPPRIPPLHRPSSQPCSSSCSLRFPTPVVLPREAALEPRCAAREPVTPSCRLARGRKANCFGKRGGTVE
eukprot:3705732-Rhodomonas_salina.2